jgi:hypothetical protein
MEEIKYSHHIIIDGSLQYGIFPLKYLITMRFFFIVLLLCFSSANAQLVDTSSPLVVSGKIPEPRDSIILCGAPYRFATVGHKEWTDWLNQNLELDSLAADTMPAGRYTVLVAFSVGKDGTLGDLNILSDPGFGLGERVKKVLANCREIWKPVLYNGDIIMSHHRQPITFVVEEECEDELPAKAML